MAGPGWPHTLLVWLYDEHGGYYDHSRRRRRRRRWTDVPGQSPYQRYPILPAVPPHRARPEAGGGLTLARRPTPGSGFRVPAVIVSPYARPDYVTDVVYDYTAVLRLVQRKWTLPPMTRRDAAAADLLDAVDLDGPGAFLTPPRLPDPGLAAPGLCGRAYLPRADRSAAWHQQRPWRRDPISPGWPDGRRSPRSRPSRLPARLASDPAGWRAARGARPVARARAPGACTADRAGPRGTGVGGGTGSGSSVVSVRASAGHISTAWRASLASQNGTGAASISGYPCSSSWTSSGTSRAQRPWPRHRVQSTVSLVTCWSAATPASPGIGSTPSTGRPHRPGEQVGAEVGREHVQRRDHEVGRAVRVRARTAAAHRGGGPAGGLQFLEPPAPVATAASARATDGSPSLHGPHWPDDCIAR